MSGELAVNHSLEVGGASLLLISFKWSPCSVIMFGNISLASYLEGPALWWLIGCRGVGLAGGSIICGGEVGSGGSLGLSCLRVEDTS